MRYVNRNFTTVYKAKETGKRFLSDRHESEQELEDTNSYINNTAIQSNEIASYPSHFEYIFEQNGKKYNSKLNQEVTFAPG